MKGRKLVALIILGIACCGFSFEFELMLMPVVYLIIAIACWLARREHTPSGASQLETALLAFSIPGSYMVSRYLGWGPHPLIFMANSLCLYQLFRLFLPMSAVHKRYALTIAILHLAVTTFVVVDWKFVVILLLALYLIPGAMMEVEDTKYKRLPGIEVKSGNWKYVVITGILMAIFFMVFPRSSSRYYTRQARMLGAVQPPQDIDMTDTTGEGTETKIMNVEGENLEYLKSFAMESFDGTTWKVGLWGRKKAGLLGRNRNTERLSAQRIATSLPRTVKVLNYRVLRERLPTDGYVVFAEVPTLNQIYISENGGLKCVRPFQRNFTYRYWTHLNEPDLWTLEPRMRQEYVKLGGFTPSERMKNWLDGIVGDTTDPETAARRLEQHFQVEFSYELGVPQLSRLAPMEDFIFNERRGHCERYASALALLLRMRDIPSRVVIGYVAREYNDIGEFYTIRDNNRHAWTEAWIPGKGWVIFDATPAGANRSLVRRNLAFTLAEWIEYTWYSKVVEFDLYQQNDLKGGVSSVFGKLYGWITTFRSAIVIVLGLIIWGYILIVAWRWWTHQKSDATEHQESMRRARLFYGKLLERLEKQQIHMVVGQTPNEFLAQLEAQGHPHIESIRIITELFCDICYGEHAFTDEVDARVTGVLSAMDSDRRAGT